MQIFKTEDTYTMIKSPIDGKLKHIPTKISYAYAYDADSPDFDYGDKDENEKELNRFRSGELVNCLIKVTASALGENGTDYLGQCFAPGTGTEGSLLLTAGEHDMKNNACIELKGNILYQWEKISEALGFKKEAVNA